MYALRIDHHFMATDDVDAGGEVEMVVSAVDLEGACQSAVGCVDAEAAGFVALDGESVAAFSHYGFADIDAGGGQSYSGSGKRKFQRNSSRCRCFG